MALEEHDAAAVATPDTLTACASVANSAAHQSCVSSSRHETAQNAPYESAETGVSGNAKQAECAGDTDAPRDKPMALDSTGTHGGAVEQAEQPPDPPTMLDEPLQAPKNASEVPPRANPSTPSLPQAGTNLSAVFAAAAHGDAPCSAADGEQHVDASGAQEGPEPCVATQAAAAGEEGPHSTVQAGKGLVAKNTKSPQKDRDAGHEPDSSTLQPPLSEQVLAGTSIDSMNTDTSSADSDSDDEDDESDETDGSDGEGVRDLASEATGVAVSVALSGTLAAHALQNVDGALHVAKTEQNDLKLGDTTLDDSNDDTEVDTDGVSDDLSADDDEGGQRDAPVRSKHELDPTAIAPVQRLKITIEEHWRVRPLGQVTAVIDGLAVVQSDQSSMAPALDSGTLLCTTERKPLGVLFETFGPVSHPCYTFRVQQRDNGDPPLEAGLGVHFVADNAFTVTPSELYRKGCDASDLYDEELPEDQQEASDDEVEAQSRRKPKRKSSELASTRDTPPAPTTSGDFAAKHRPSHSGGFRGRGGYAERGRGGRRAGDLPRHEGSGRPLSRGGGHTNWRNTEGRRRTHDQTQPPSAVSPETRPPFNIQLSHAPPPFPAVQLARHMQPPSTAYPMPTLPHPHAQTPLPPQQPRQPPPPAQGGGLWPPPAHRMPPFGPPLGVPQHALPYASSYPGYGPPKPTSFSSILPPGAAPYPPQAAAPFPVAASLNATSPMPRNAFLPFDGGGSSTLVPPHTMPPGRAPQHNDAQGAPRTSPAHAAGEVGQPALSPSALLAVLKTSNASAAGAPNAFSAAWGRPTEAPVPLEQRSLTRSAPPPPRNAHSSSLGVAVEGGFSNVPMPLPPQLSTLPPPSTFVYRPQSQPHAPPR